MEDLNRVGRKWFKINSHLYFFFDFFFLKKTEKQINSMIMVLLYLENEF